MVLGMVAIAVGIFIAVVMQATTLSILSYAGGFVCMLATYFLHRKDEELSAKGVCISVIYFAFIYIPIDWYIYGGVLGSTPYASLIILTIMALAFSKKKRKIVIPLYVSLILLLSIHSITTEILFYNSERLSEIIITMAAYYTLIAILIYIRTTMLGSLEKHYRKTFDGSIKDTLTGVLNRRGLDELILQAEIKYLEKNLDYTIVMIDVDMLKEHNDKHGHTSGDVMLKRLGACITRGIRDADYVLRYGGDEFLILLQSIPKENVDIVFGRIDGLLQNEYNTHRDFEVSFSRGFAQRSEFDSPDNMVEIADKRMYENKYSSREK